jgi:hypothetical protein
VEPQHRRVDRSINIFLYGLIGPFAAALYQRVGLRRMMMRPWR